jgi:hypothetical protein
MSNSRTEYGGNVIDHGAEIEFTDDRSNHAPKRVEFLNGSWVRCTYRQQYEVKVFPPHAIAAVHTHTSSEEEASWDE